MIPFLANLSSQEYLAKVVQTLPELPKHTRQRLLAIGLSERDVDVLMTIDAGKEIGYDGELSQGAVAYFDLVSKGRNPKTVMNWCVSHPSCATIAQ